MFWILVIFALVSQLPTTTSSLSCLTCSLPLNTNSSDGINTANCTNPAVSQVCRARLDIYHMLDNGLVTFGEGSPGFDDVLNGKNLIKHTMYIGLDQNLIHRIVELFCFNNNSCSEDMKKIYEKSK